MQADLVTTPCALGLHSCGCVHWQKETIEVFGAALSDFQPKKNENQAHDRHLCTCERRSFRQQAGQVKT